MPRGKRLPKENPEAGLTDMPPMDGSNEMSDLHVPSTESMESDGMGGMGSPTAVKSRKTSNTGGGAHKPHGDHPHHGHGHKSHFEDPQPQGHDLRSHHGYDLRTNSFAK